MKRHLVLAALLFATPAATSAAPRLFVSTPQLAPESEIELILDRAAVADDMIGKPAPAAPWLRIKPPLPATLAWKSPNVARVLLEGVPAIGASYEVTLVAGHRHCDGTPVPAGPLGVLAAEPFKVESGAILGRYEEGFSRRTAAHLLRFNDDVDPAAVAGSCAFANKQGVRAEARARRPQGDELPPPASLTPSWTERFRARGAPADQPAEPRGDNLVVVAPAAPLPVGEGWRLVVEPGVPNAAGSAAAPAGFSGWIGDVEPFTVRGVEAAVAADQPRRVVVRFSASLAAGQDAARFVQVEPPPEGLVYQIDGAEVVVGGDFRARDNWSVTVQPGIESSDGLPLAAGLAEKLKFGPVEPELRLPSHAGPQLAHGSRGYRIHTVNLAALQVRAKRLAGTGLLRALQGYRHYTGDGPNGEWLRDTGAIPWEMVDGEPVIDLAVELPNPVDTSREVQFDWDQLLPAGATCANLFLEVRGTPKQGVVDEERPGQAVAQALVQLTDLGVGWKLGPADSLLYAFSCQTGEPLAGVRFELFGEDAKPLANATSDADGLARIARDPAARSLVAQLGGDTFATAFDDDLPTVGLWNFPVRHSWGEPRTSERRVFLFTDRSLYRPGETAHLKGVVRTREGNAIAPHQAGTTRLVVVDPAEREVLRAAVTLSERGTFDHSLRLPAGTVGTYQVRFEYADEVDRAEQLGDDEWAERWRLLADARFQLDLQVAEFRRNAFEVTHTLAPPAPGAAEVALELAAAYYQGQPVARGKVQTWTRVTNTNFYPETFRDFLFGDHRSYDPWYWAHYFGYRDDAYYSSRSDTETGTLELDAAGHATVSARLPQNPEPSTRELRISTEVTDANLQALTTTTETIVHPAGVYAGIGRVDRLVRINDAVELPLVAVTPAGEPFQSPLEVEVAVTREVNEQVKIAKEGGGSAVRNETRELPVSTTRLTLAPAGNAGAGTAFAFQPAQPGRHIVAVSGTDPDGRRFLTRSQIHVYGSDEYPWAYEDGIKIKLVAEKRSYRPGETARILVLSPIEGTALVTVEREGVLRSFRTRLTTAAPVIEIPLADADAPNAYVSVLVVKGARESSRKHPEPQLRLGYCELTVDNLRDRLAVELAATGPDSADAPAPNKPPEVMPGDAVTLAGTVRHADGSPAAGAEVTVWAEDEGVLAVMGYENPDPMAFFYNPRELAIRSGTSLEMFLPEAPDQQEFFNKGFWVGGGGWDASGIERLRRDFRPCAVWAPALVTAADGSFTVTFTAPDTLTRYRVLAVASHGAARFGGTQSALVVAQPLMLEPKPPRFALEGDHAVLPVTVQNASDYAGTWKLTLKQGDLTAVEETLDLEPGKSATLAHAVAFDASGDTTFQWSAVPVALRQRQLDPALARRLSDAVEHHVPVGFPMPLLRDHLRVALDGGAAPRDLLEGIDAALRDGRGEVELECGRSLLLEAGGAVDYLLHFPYGCLEQTTSAMIPWLAVDALRPVVPRFAGVPQDRVQQALRTGVERLLAMQRPDGGFSYWPDGTERVDWATSYGGLGLVLARKAGADVPAAAVDALCTDLSNNLRGLAEAAGSQELENAARALWVLALAGQPQEAYRNQLVERIAELDRANRCLLALAAAAEGTDEGRRIAASLLADATRFRGKDDRWMPWRNDRALELLARATIDPAGEETAAALDRLLRDRSPYGHWRTTWANGWALLGMAACAGPLGGGEQSVAITIQTPDGPRAITLNPEQPTASLRLPLAPGLTLPASADGKAFVRVNVSAKPAVAPQQPVGRNGLEITRSWERVLADGTREPLAKPAPGDLILVSLRVTLPGDDSRYLVVEDYLPAIFETVDQRFGSQAAAGAAVQQAWSISHQELRDDRAVFFLDWMPSSGTYTVQYLARCTLAGEATAPPAKVESMYDPENYALSASRRFTTR